MRDGYTFLTNRLVVATIAIFISVTSWAMAPGIVNYQGYLTDTGGAPLDTTVQMIFSVYDEEGSTTALWDETHTAVTVTDGIFDVQLGVTEEFGSDLFEDATMWLGITVGDNSEMTPRIQFTSVPYAYRIATVDGAAGGTINGKLNVGTGNTNSGMYAMVAGLNNHAHGDYSVITGGGGENLEDSNSAVGNASAIGGGSGNETHGVHSVISGGRFNRTRGFYSVVGGGGSWMPEDSNAAIGDWATVSGGRANHALEDYCSVGGGLYNTAISDLSTVAGGYDNNAGKYASAVCGGWQNEVLDEGTYSFIGGGQWNYCHGAYSTMGGGSNNSAWGYFSTVVGGGGTSRADSNSAVGTCSFVGGGRRNISGGPFGSFTTIAGGDSNRALSGCTTVGGGKQNVCGNSYGTIGGGFGNQVLQGMVGMGSYATIAGGASNATSGDYSSIGGGYLNTVEGMYTTVPGGYLNRASGSYSFAAGNRAKANNQGCFVWADATNSDFSISSNNQFAARASGGVYFYTNAGLTSGMYMSAGGSSWVMVSDSTKKQNIRPVNTGEILEKVAQLPIKQWSYKSQDPSIEHVGPMAQDFWNLFHIGEDSLGINQIDPDGIALAAIQELVKQNQALEARVAQLERQFSAQTKNDTQTALNTINKR